MDPIYNLQFGAICLSSFLFSASFNMLIAELPSYLVSLGGSSYRGWVIGLFTLTAALSRPLSGKLTDTCGRVPVMIVGSLVCVACGLLYPSFPSVLGFLLIRAMHGFSTGFKPTASTAFVADVIPQARLGEALGLHGFCYSLGLALGPVLGSWIHRVSSFQALFQFSACFALVSVLILVNQKETLKHPVPFSFKLLRVKRQDWFAPEVLPLSFIAFLIYLAYGTLLTLMPDWSEFLGFKNRGYFFLVLSGSSLTIRLFAGKCSDRYGRAPVMALGLTGFASALAILGLVQTRTGLLAGAVLYGLSTGMLSPALNAWTVGLSHRANRGKALGTLYIAMEAGIGVGALLSGWCYQGVLARVPSLVLGAALTGVCALGYGWCLHRQQQKTALVVALAADEGDRLELQGQAREAEAPMVPLVPLLLAESGPKVFERDRSL